MTWWPFKRKPSVSQSARDLALAAQAKQKARQDATTDELRRDIAAGKHSIIPSREQVVRSVLIARALKRERQARG